MIYLLDADVLIDANRYYYPIGRVPEFWDWLVDLGKKGLVKIPIEIYEEIKAGKVKEDEEKGKIDHLPKWAREQSTVDALLFGESVDESLMARILDEGYATDLTDEEVIKIGRDPFLIAYALKNPTERCIVTTELSKPTATRGNRHLPDVCNGFGISTCHTFGSNGFIQALDFKTSWNHVN